MSLQVGDKAPDFKLNSSELKEVSLSDFKGKKVILHFFPLAFTGVCTTQLCTMRDSFGYYNGLNAQILGISVDSPFALAKFKEEQAYQFPLLCDFVLGLKGVAKRSAFVIDEEGKIIYAEVLEDAGNLPNFEAINKVVAG